MSFTFILSTLQIKRVKIRPKKLPDIQYTRINQDNSANNENGQVKHP